MRKAICLFVMVISMGRAMAGPVDQLSLSLFNLTNPNLTDIVAYEYWFNDEFATRTHVAVSPMAEFQLDMDISADDLPLGLNTIHLRFLDSEGYWSSVSSQYFLKLSSDPSGGQQIAAYEFWFDENYDEKMVVNVTPDEEVQIIADLPVGDLQNGLHSIHLRFRDVGGQWSSVISQYFLKLSADTNGGQQIAGYEYWFDENYGSRTDVSITPMEEAVIDADLPAGDLPNGLHTLYLRFRDMGGQWSSVSSQYFLKVSAAAGGGQQMAAYEYWYDDDYSNRTEVAITPSEEAQIVTELPTTGLAVGLHVLHIRFKDAGGQWSGVSSQYFTKLGNAGSDNKIVAYRFWVDLNDEDMVEVLIPTPVELLVLDEDLDLTSLPLAPHTLHIQFKDANGNWSSVLSSEFNIGIPPVASFTASVMPCENGQVEFANSSSLATDWLWEFGDGNSSTELEPTHTYAAPGTYTVKLTASDSGSGFSASFETIVDAEFQALELLVATTQSNCPDTNDGTALATVTNGSTPFDYHWSNGGTGASLADLSPDTYEVTVSDANGCEKTTSFDIIPVSGLSASISGAMNPSCPNATDGSAEVVAVDGILPYAYLWSNNETTAIANNLPAGNVSVTVTDANNCVAVVSTDLDDPNSFSIAVASNDVSCPGGTDGNAAVSVNGGTGPFSYLWSTGQTAEVITGLLAAIYSVTVMDANGCEITQNVSVGQPDPITINATQTDVSCNGMNDGTATVTVVGGGSPPYSILWNNGSSSFNLTGLGAGTYTASILDANGCTYSPDAANITQPDVLTLAPQNLTIDCDDEVTTLASISGGTAPYDVNWSDGTMSSLTAVLMEGSYDHTVTDANGCTDAALLTVTLLNSSPVFDFTGNFGFEDQFSNPPGGSPNEIYRMEIRYFDAEGDLPPAGYPRMFLDFEGDGQLNGPNDQSYALDPVDPSDLDPTDGKEYFTILTGIIPSPDYQTYFRANEMTGCLNESGPFPGPDIVDSTDLFLFANDIEFSNPIPDPLEEITVTATIHNESDFPAENFACRLTNMNTGQIFAPVVVPLLEPDNTTQVSWTITTPPDPSWNPMKVEIDVDDVIPEPNELDNQAIRPFINGAYNLLGSINIMAEVTPDPSVYHSSAYLSLRGNAFYEDTAVPLTDPSVAGATVFFTIQETQQTFGGFTNENGNFSISFPQPNTGGVYHISGSITDYTLNQTFTDTFTVVPLPCLKPDLIGTIELVDNNILVGGSINGTVHIRNAGGTVSTATNVRLYSQGGSPEYSFLNVPALQPEEEVSLPLPIISYAATGSTNLRAEVDFDFQNDECSEANNITLAGINVLPDLPDIEPIWWNKDLATLWVCNEHGFTYRIKNQGGLPTGPFSVTWKIEQSGNVTDSLMQTIQNIAPREFTYVTFTYTFPSADVYDIKLSCDPLNEVVEFNELNNTFNRLRSVPICPAPPQGPDLVWEGCDSREVTPVDPDGTVFINISSVLKNQGNVVATAPFEVELEIEHEDMIPSFFYYTQTITQDLLPGQTMPVDFEIPRPEPPANHYKFVADDGNQLVELEEGNNVASGPLDWNFRLGRNTCCSTNNCMFWERPVTTPNLYFSVSLYNDGEYEASQVSVQFEVSGPGLSGWVNLGNGLVDQVDKTCPCPQGAVLPNAFTFPNTGVYSVRMTADPDNQFLESDETDNVLTVQVEIKPDMAIVSEFIAPSALNPDPEEPISIAVTYGNEGFKNPLDSMDLALMIDGFDHASVRVPGLLSGDHNTVEFPTPWAFNIIGLHVIRAIIDSEEEIPESDELNNEATRAIHVGEASNLRFATFAPNNTHPAMGEPLIISATIENNGDLPASGTYQLFYVTDAQDTVLIGQSEVSLTSGAQDPIPFLWPVVDKQTTLIGQIINSDPLEFRYDDNTVEAILGGLNVEVTTTPERCIPFTGTATATILNGTPPYQYLWTTGQLGETIEGLGAGNYELTVTDANGASAIAGFAVEHEPHPAIDFDVMAASCDQDDGAVTAHVVLGEVPLTFAWSNGATESSLNGLAPALYGLTVTDGLGCVSEEEVVVGLNTQLASDENCEIEYPRLFLSQGEINVGETQIITGIGFIPNGRAFIYVSGEEDNLLETTISTNEFGAFEYQLPITSNATDGQYNTSAFDEVSGFDVEKYFIVRNPIVVQSKGIRIIQPTSEKTYESNSVQRISWVDDIIQSPEYPSTGYKRGYKYILEISEDEGPWKTLGIVPPNDEIGYALFDSELISSFDYNVPSSETSYRIRIQDLFRIDNNQEFKTTDELRANIKEFISAIFSSRKPDPNKAQITKQWDFSILERKSSPEGVAADGVSRIYLEVYHENLASGTLTLTPADGIGEGDTRYLGKVMEATETKKYSDEANGADAISASGTSNNGLITFWYVAPDEFVRNGDDNELNERLITARFEGQSTDGTPIPGETSIEIVRPPLVLAHGQSGEPERWDKFKSSRGKLKSDDLFKVNTRVKFFPSAAFDANSECLLGISENCEPIQKLIEGDIISSIPETLEKMADIRYAANRVDYVGHSMGGAIVRNSFDTYRDSFLRGDIKSNYNNYKAGFINKFMTIATPHHGSPFGNMVEQVVRFLNETVSFTSFRYANLAAQDDVAFLFLRSHIKFNHFNRSEPYAETRPAIINLRETNGVQYSTTGIKSHLIVGDIVSNSNKNTICEEVFDRWKKYFNRVLSTKYESPIILKYFF
ncbi:MAG: CARDB domain-containing protein, partial [Bacteroidota bacterium]